MVNDGRDMGRVWVDLAGDVERVGDSYVWGSVWCEFHDNADVVGPRLRLRLNVKAGRLEVQSAEFVAEEGSRGVRAKDFDMARRNLTQLIAIAVANIPTFTRDDDGRLWLTAADSAVAGSGRPKYRYWTHERRQELARVYRENVEGGAPAKAVAAHFGMTDQMDAVSKAISNARRDGYLPKTKQGKATG